MFLKILPGIVAMISIIGWTFYLNKFWFEVNKKQREDLTKTFMDGLTKFIETLEDIQKNKTEINL